MASAVESRIDTASRLAGLDLLRLLAALAVVAFHLAYAGPMRGAMATSYPEIAGLAKYGFLGVDLFFVVSGLVIAGAIEGRSAAQFARARLLRLYPAHLACMTATALVLLAASGGAAPTWPQWIANLTMVAPMLGQPFMDGAYWSIVIEIVFYGWAGLLMWLGVLQRRLLTILAVWLALAALNELVLQLRPLRFLLATEYAGLLASGVLIARLRTGHRSGTALVLLALAVAHGALHALESQRLFARLYADELSLPVLLSLHLGIYAVVVAGLWASRFIPPSRLVLTLGGLTYPLYLLHQEAGYVGIDMLAPVLGRWAAAGVVVAAALAAAWAVYAVAEPVGRRWLRRALDAFGATAIALQHRPAAVR